MESNRKARLPWAIVLLIVAFACAIAYAGAFIYTRMIDTGSFASYRTLLLSSVQRAEAVSDGFVYYDGSTLVKVGSDAQSRWSSMVGAGVEFSATDAGVAVWNDRRLTLIDGATGVTGYSNNMDEEVLSARMGDVYTAVLLGPEHDSTIVLMESGGRKVDSITLASQTVVDYGFFYNDTLFWVMTLDTNGTVPSCTISTYRPGRRIVGQIADSEQMLYDVMFRSAQIYCAGDTYLKVYDYNGTEQTDQRKLVYGWMLAHADDAADNPLMAFVPSGQYDGTSGMRDVRMVRGDAEQTVRMPFDCASIIAKGNRAYGFSSDGYVMIAQMGTQKVNAYRLDMQFDTVYGVADGGIAILGQGDRFYFVSLS